MTDTVETLLDHENPLGFISLLGGIKRSYKNFAPWLGGPLCLLIGFHVGGIVYLFVPKDLNTIIHNGVSKPHKIGHTSPLDYSEVWLTRMSGVRLQNYSGYSKAAASFRAGIYTLTNYEFWTKSICLQIMRFGEPVNAIKRLAKPFRLVCYLALAICLPVYILVCAVELVFSVLYYGIPLLMTIGILLRSYHITMNEFLNKSQWQHHEQMSEIVGFKILKSIIRLLSFLMFCYFIISFCFIMVSSFCFVCQVIVFCIISVFVYPSTAFGYLFFTGVVLVYAFKQLEGIGHGPQGYFELLSMAVEICTHMEEDIAYARIDNDVIVINQTNGTHISRIQVQNHTINLSTDQRNQIASHHCGKQRRISYQNDHVGIPRELFDNLVNHIQPVHVTVFHALVRLTLIGALVAGMVSLIVVKPFGSNEAIAEILHFVLIVAIGALPKLLEILVDTSTNRSATEEIKRKQVKAFISDYWTQKDGILMVEHNDSLHSLNSEGSSEIQQI